MKKEIALQLADAITSGHYKRTGGINRYVNHKTKVNSFCIGGVLINLFAQAHPDLAAKETNPYSFMGCITNIPSAVVTWAGLHDGYMDAIDGRGITIAGHKFDGLQRANDQRVSNMPTSAFCVSWEEIADWLRSGENYKLI